jgi:hypothetical protein
MADLLRRGARVDNQSLAFPRRQQDTASPPRAPWWERELILAALTRLNPFAAVGAGIARLTGHSPLIGSLGEAIVRQQEGGFVRHRGIEVSSRLAPYLEKLDAYAAAQGGAISWTSGHRTRAEQNALFARWEGGDLNVPFEPLPYEQSKHATGDAADGEASSTALALALGQYAHSLGMGWSAHEPWHFEV